MPSSKPRWRCVDNYSVRLQSVTSLGRTQAGAKFVVCDAGGSTVDISAYRVNNRTAQGVDVEELEVPSCKYQKYVANGA